MSKEEMNVRRNEQRCLKYGRNKCQVNKCPLLSTRSPVKARKVHSTEVIEATVKEEEEGDTSPENWRLLPPVASRSTRKLFLNGKNFRKMDKWINKDFTSI
jgi:hypothetical protein